MSKYHIDVIIGDKSISIQDLFNYTKYNNLDLVRNYNDIGFQIVSTKIEEGYVNVYEENFNSLLSIDGMYDDNVVSELNKLTISSKLFTILFVGEFGFRFVDETLYYIKNKYTGTMIFILDDQGNEILKFEEFINKHQKTNFFWLPKERRIRL